ncbi:MAG: hypothetical protein JXQ65_07470 [Candidatus Marinimicrobia bacterium]|nr:hypothetical protein [Candidatus Neomarinimicrobiota bacterium]
MNVDFIDKLINISLDHLSESINDDQLFFNRLKENNQVISRVDSSTRYSIISLIGLYQARNFGYTVEMNLEYLTSRIVSRLKKISLPDLGLLLWLAAVAVDDNLARIVYDELDRRLTKKSIRSLMTVSAAWILTGLSKSYALINEEAGVEQLLKSLSVKVLQAFNKNTGLFASFNGRKFNFIAGTIYSEIGCFADQAYSILALSEYVRIFDDSLIKTIIDQATSRNISLQGNHGDWPWIFDVEKGTVLEKYPIYSVHQSAMAPMALRAAEKALTKDFSGTIHKSLDWFNKVDFDDNGFIDENQNIIWRSIKKRGRNKSIFDFLGLNYGGLTACDKRRIFGKIILNRKSPKNEAIMQKLIVDYESRPYHYGWILYTFCTA